MGGRNSKQQQQLRKKWDEEWRLNGSNITLQLRNLVPGTVELQQRNVEENDGAGEFSLTKIQLGKWSATKEDDFINFEGFLVGWKSLTRGFFVDFALSGRKMIVLTICGNPRDILEEVDVMCMKYKRNNPNLVFCFGHAEVRVPRNIPGEHLYHTHILFESRRQPFTRLSAFLKDYDFLSTFAKFDLIMQIAKGMKDIEGLWPPLNPDRILLWPNMKKCVVPSSGKDVKIWHFREFGGDEEMICNSTTLMFFPPEVLEYRSRDNKIIARKPPKKKGSHFQSLEIYCFASLCWCIWHCGNCEAFSFEEDSEIGQREILRKIREEEHRPPIKNPRGCPAFLLDVMKKCWVTDPKARPMKVSDILKDLGDEKSRYGQLMSAQMQSFSRRDTEERIVFLVSEQCSTIHLDFRGGRRVSVPTVFWSEICFTSDDEHDDE